MKKISDILFIFKVWGEQQQRIYEITFFNLFRQLSELVSRKLYFNVKPWSNGPESSRKWTQVELA